MNPPVGEAAMPYGCEPNGSAIVRVTVWLDGLMTLISRPRLLVTQTSPFGAMAMDRGAVADGDRA